MTDTVTIPQADLKRIRDALEDYRSISVVGATIKPSSIRAAIELVDKHLASQQP